MPRERVDRVLRGTCGISSRGRWRRIRYRAATLAATARAPASWIRPDRRRVAFVRAIRRDDGILHSVPAAAHRPSPRHSADWNTRATNGGASCRVAAHDGEMAALRRAPRGDRAPTTWSPAPAPVGEPDVPRSSGRRHRDTRQTARSERARGAVAVSIGRAVAGVDPQSAAVS